MDDDIGRKTDLETPLVGREAVEGGAVALATTDPEDSDVNVLFKGLQIEADLAGDVTVAAVAGTDARETDASLAVGRELDRVLTELAVPPEEVRTVVVTDGAQDESVIPVIRSRITVDGVRRVVVRQAEDLESIYYTIKQVLNDPETRGTILVPLGILLLIYPLAIGASLLGVPGTTVVGVTSGLIGLYLIARGLDLHTTLVSAARRARQALYTGRVTLITYSVAMALLVVAGISGINRLDAVQGSVTSPSALTVVAALVDGALVWVTAAGITTSLGQITDAYLTGQFRPRYLNAPFYVVAIAAVLHGLSGYVLEDVSLAYMAAVLAAGTMLGLASTLAFAVAEARTTEDAQSVDA